MSCISSSHISIQINEGKTSFFKSTRGIRQGDPLSHYIFIMCMELLSRRINHEFDLLNWTSISTCPKGPKISHFFFADDLTLFARADDKNCQTIINTLNNFSIYSRQKVNISKSKVIFSHNCSLVKRDTLASKLQIQAKMFFWKYLGFPIFHQKPHAKDFTFILDNLNTKLRGWKTRFLNMGVEPFWQMLLVGPWLTILCNTLASPTKLMSLLTKKSEILSGDPPKIREGYSCYPGIWLLCHKGRVVLVSKKPNSKMHLCIWAWLGGSTKTPITFGPEFCMPSITAILFLVLLWPPELGGTSWKFGITVRKRHLECQKWSKYKLLDG